MIMLLNQWAPPPGAGRADCGTNRRLANRDLFGWGAGAEWSEWAREPCALRWTFRGPCGHDCGGCFHVRTKRAAKRKWQGGLAGCGRGVRRARAGRCVPRHMRIAARWLTTTALPICRAASRPVGRLGAAGLRLKRTVGRPAGRPAECIHNADSRVAAVIRMGLKDLTNR